MFCSLVTAPSPSLPGTVREAAADVYGRPLQSLRISVIDRCDLRCAYCMPEDEYTWLPKADILTFEEILVLVDAFAANGVRRVRLTGGEPLLRARLPDLIAGLDERGLDDIALTTNATQLARHARALREAGLRRVTVSLDSLKPARFETLTRRAALDDVIAGIEASAAAGFESLKINTVVMRDFNDDEIVDLVDFGRRVGAEVRFIEYMDVGGATRWSMDDVVSRREMLDRLAAHYGGTEAVDESTAAPADRFTLPDGLVFGIISSTTEPFCRQCDRSRLTADGLWYRCLYARTGTDLRGPLRAGAGREALEDLIAATWRQRDDRGAEERLAAADRSTFIPVEALQSQPHLEMHTRGG